MRSCLPDTNVCMLQGTKLLFYDSHSDVLLLDIPGSIPDRFHAYSLGFDARDATPARALAIHHPAGNIKRISYANTSCAPPHRSQFDSHCIALQMASICLTDTHECGLPQYPWRCLLHGSQQHCGCLAAGRL